MASRQAKVSQSCRLSAPAMQAAHYLIRMHLDEGAYGLVALPPREGLDQSYSAGQSDDKFNADVPAAKRLKQSRIVTDRER